MCCFVISCTSIHYQHQHLQIHIQIGKMWRKNSLLVYHFIFVIISLQDTSQSLSTNNFNLKIQSVFVSPAEYLNIVHPFETSWLLLWISDYPILSHSCLKINPTHFLMSSNHPTPRIMPDINGAYYPTNHYRKKNISFPYIHTYAEHQDKSGVYVIIIFSSFFCLLSSPLSFG